jgi:hypothetical protein
MKIYAFVQNGRTNRKLMRKGKRFATNYVFGFHIKEFLFFFNFGILFELNFFDK